MVWIAIFALLVSLADAVFIIHTLLCVNRYYRGLADWAKEIDRCNSSYIRQEFAKLKFENNLVIRQEDED